jgi:hypothetical protein
MVYVGQQVIGPDYTAQSVAMRQHLPSFLPVQFPLYTGVSIVSAVLQDSLFSAPS